VTNHSVADFLIRKGGLQGEVTFPTRSPLKTSSMLKGDLPRGCFHHVGDRPDFRNLLPHIAALDVTLIISQEKAPCKADVPGVLQAVSMVHFIFRAKVFDTMMLEGAILCIFLDCQKLSFH
jgi:hypothetical protein